MKAKEHWIKAQGYDPAWCDWNLEGGGFLGGILALFAGISGGRMSLTILLSTGKYIS